MKPYSTLFKLRKGGAFFNWIERGRKTPSEALRRRAIQNDRMDNPYPASPEPELFLSIRFSASLPDVLLEVASPKTTTTAGLKRLIRARLPQELSNHRLRLIHAGKALEDSTPLATSLRLNSLPPPPNTKPSSPAAPGIAGDDEDEDEAKDKKGKSPVRVEPQPRIYIHCSIGDVALSASDLAAEASLASTTTARSSKAKKNTSSHFHGEGTPTNPYQGDPQRDQPTTTAPAATTTPAPRGFDSLASAGLSDVEISALRAQFRHFQSLSRTPDTMLSTAELRILEERWLDNSDSYPPPPADGNGGGGRADDGGDGNSLDDMLWGSVMGFFWPVGCAIWLMREDGVWSWRKGLAVSLGVGINALLGIIRHIG